MDNLRLVPIVICFPFNFSYDKAEFETTETSYVYFKVKPSTFFEFQLYLMNSKNELIAKSKRLNFTTEQENIENFNFNQRSDNSLVSFNST